MDLFPPDLCLYNKCKEFSEHGTISSIVYQNIIITAVLEISEFRVRRFLREWGWKKKTYASLTGLRMSVSPYVTQGLGVLVFRMLAFKISAIQPASIRRRITCFLFISAAWQTI